MPLELTPEQARRLGIKVPGVRPKKDRSVARGPYHWRCNCGETGSGEKAAGEHAGRGHIRFETIPEET